MADLIGLVWAGMVSGCLYAMGAVGIVLVYKSSNVVNFAHGNLAGLSAFLVFGFTGGTLAQMSWGAAVLLAAVSKGSGDSFALRNHARKAMLPRDFPEKSFPPEYVLKDIDCLLELAAQTGVGTHVTRLARRYYEAALNNGWSGRYYPAVIEIVDRDIGPAPAGARDGD